MIVRQAAPAAFLLMLAGPAPLPPSPPMQLVSLTVPMSPEERIDAFEVVTTGVDILAVCRMPAMWTLSAGENSSVTGTLAGQSGYGAARLGPADHASLAHLFLVRVHPRRAGMPPNFDGTTTLVTPGLQPRERVARISGNELRLTQAAHCPAPS
jgi:hypothetical protein